MQQRGSKYDQKIKDEALALVASGVSITNAACRLRIPKSTLADWVHTQNESDEDGVAAGGKSAESRSHGARRSGTRYCVHSTARPRPPRRTPGPSMTVWRCSKRLPRTA